MTRILNKDNLTGHHLSNNKNAIVSDMASLLSTVGAVEGWIGSGSHGSTVLANQPTVDRARLAAIGFCQGGIVVTELARVRAPILCAIGFHPGLKRPSGSFDGPIAAKLLMMVGDRDPAIQPDDRAAFAAEMEEKGADWQLHLFGGRWTHLHKPPCG